MRKFFSQISMRRITGWLVVVNNLCLLIFSKLIPNFFTESIDLLQAFILGRKRKKQQAAELSLQLGGETGAAPIGGKSKKKKKIRRRRRRRQEDSLKFKMKQLKPHHFVLGSIMAIVAVVNCVVIYHNWQKIARDIEDRSRGPASFPAAMRKSYFGTDRRHFHLSSLHVPIYLEGGPQGMSSMQIEFILETSNRFLKNYIDKNEYEISDRILTTLEPITPGFIFTDEGQQVMRLKILREVNQLIEHKKMQGQIERVSMGSIIAG